MWTCPKKLWAVNLGMLTCWPSLGRGIWWIRNSKRSIMWIIWIKTCIIVSKEAKQEQVWSLHFKLRCKHSKQLICNRWTMDMYNSNHKLHFKWNIIKQSVLNCQIAKIPRIRAMGMKITKFECRCRMKDRVCQVMWLGPIINRGSRIIKWGKVEVLYKYLLELGWRNRRVRTQSVIRVTRGCKMILKTWCLKMILTMLQLKIAIRKVKDHKGQNSAKFQSKTNLIKDKKLLT